MHLLASQGMEKTRNALWVDLPENFGAGFVLELFGELHDVRKMHSIGDAYIVYTPDTVCLSTCLSVDLSIYTSIYLHYLSAKLSVYLSIYLFICLSICHLSIY